MIASTMEASKNYSADLMCFLFSCVTRRSRLARFSNSRPETTRWPNRSPDVQLFKLGFCTSTLEQILAVIHSPRTDFRTHWSMQAGEEDYVGVVEDAASYGDLFAVRGPCERRDIGGLTIEVQQS
jgi:hypothetical protein